jgi:SAM-dependent methyltransferase
VEQSRHFERVRQNWEHFGERDPMFGVLSIPGKEGTWEADEFYEYGRGEIASMYGQIDQAGVHPPSDHVLDFGCGVGRLSFALAERFDEVDGVDISPAMLAMARERNVFGDRCRFHQYDGNDLGRFAAGTFGMVVSLMTLQHVPPPMVPRYLGEMVRVTRAGGVIAVQMPDVRRVSLKARVREAANVLIYHRMLRRPRMEMHARTAADVARIFAAAGATVVGAIPDGRCGDWGPSLLHVAVKPDR